MTLWSRRVGRVTMVTGAAGQDGCLLTRRLLREGSTVHAVARSRASAASISVDDARRGRLYVHAIDLVDGPGLADLIARVMPDELYNLAGLSSVSASFADPVTTWATNAHAVVVMLEAVRQLSPVTHFYQASSSEMFGGLPGESVVHDEASPLRPQSPYAAAKASAHLACHAYRAAFGLRVACGISFNHESSRRPRSFLTRKVVDHVRRVRSLDPADRASAAPLLMGNLVAQRDWGFAPDYVEGIMRIARQVEVRAGVLGGEAEPDVAGAYRDYVLGTGKLHAVWELVDRAFALAGLNLEWSMSDEDPACWNARFQDSGVVAVAVDPRLIRPTDPMAISADPTRARVELGWEARPGLDTFLQEMLDAA